MTQYPRGENRAIWARLFASSGGRRLPRAVRIVVLIVAVLASGVYYHRAARAWRAQRYAEEFTPENLKKASELEPGNAEYRYRIGRYSLLTQDFPSAIRDFQTAIALNPYDARYWLDLASAYLASGDSEGEQRALARAAQADPTTPEVIWQTANYELVEGDTNEAMRRFRTLVEHNPESLPKVLNVCWRAVHDPAPILDAVLPPVPDAHLVFIRFLLSKRQPKAAAQAWAHLIALKTPFTVQQTFPYFDYLFEHGDFTQAADDWRQLAVPNPDFRAYVPDDNAIVNGGFELDLLNGGLDWRYAPRTGSALVIDVNRSHSGTRSLAVTFDGAPEDAGIYQLVPVHANTRYQFSGYMMSEDLQTVNPPRFSIRGLKSNANYVLTDGLQGTTPWQELDGEFTTGPADDLLLVKIARKPSLIRGRLWVDDLKLLPQPAQESR